MKLYLCAGNRTGVSNPDEWLCIDLPTDVRTLTPSMFPGLTQVFATPPCGKLAEMPWLRITPAEREEAISVLIACWDFCQDAGVPWLLENSRFAQKYLGPADFHRGPHYFWGRGVGLIPDFTHYKGGTSGLKPLERAKLPVILP